MRTAVAAALLLALSSPVGAVSITPECIPIEQAVATIEAAGGEIIYTSQPPFAAGMILYFVYEGDVFAAGVDVANKCVYSPSTAVGKYIEGNA